MSRLPARSIKITVPPIPRLCSPNGRGHWTVKAKAKRTAREIAKDEALVACHPIKDIHDWGFPWDSATMHIEWFYARQKPDKDNCLASLKSTIDGIVDSGLLSDDDEITYPPLVRTHDPKNPRVEITITRSEQGA